MIYYTYQDLSQLIYYRMQLIVIFCIHKLGLVKYIYIYIYTYILGCNIKYIHMHIKIPNHYVYWENFFLYI